MNTQATHDLPDEPEQPSPSEGSEAYDNMAKAVEEAAAAAGLGVNDAASPFEPAPTEQVDNSAEVIAAYEQEIATLNDRLLRSAAETENVRRRAQKEKEDANKYAISGLAREMVAVVENLHRALDSLPEEAAKENETLATLRDGVSMTLRELLNVLERHGIKRIYPEGELFDHNFHQAMVQIDSDDHPEGTVLQVMQAGYVIHSRLLQPAMVGVSKRITPEAAAPTNDNDQDDSHVDTEA